MNNMENPGEKLSYKIFFENRRSFSTVILCIISSWMLSYWDPIYSIELYYSQNLLPIMSMPAFMGILMTPLVFQL